MFFDQIHIYFVLSEHRVDMGIGFAVEFVDLKVFPPCDSRHELDAEEKSQTEDREVLGVGVAINRVGFNVRLPGKKGIQYESDFIDATRNESGEKCDVLV